MAWGSAISVIQGPPGTGKTFLAAVMALKLVLVEDGHIFALAPSNRAADGLAISLQKIIQDERIPANVVRIYAQSKESQYMRDNLNPRKY